MTRTRINSGTGGLGGRKGRNFLRGIEHNSLNEFDNDKIQCITESQYLRMTKSKFLQKLLVKVSEGIPTRLDSSFSVTLYKCRQYASAFDQSLKISSQQSIPRCSNSTTHTIKDNHEWFIVITDIMTG
jgi:hypothetical protein